MLKWVSTPIWVAMIGTANAVPFVRRGAMGRRATIYAIWVGCTNICLKLCVI